MSSISRRCMQSMLQVSPNAAVGQAMTCTMQVPTTLGCVQLLCQGARVARRRSQAVLDRFQGDASDRFSTADFKLRQTLRFSKLSCACLGVNSDDLVWVAIAANDVHPSEAPCACNFEPAVVGAHRRDGSWSVRAHDAQGRVHADSKKWPESVDAGLMFPRHTEQPLPDRPPYAVDHAFAELLGMHVAPLGLANVRSPALQLGVILVLHWVTTKSSTCRVPHGHARRAQLSLPEIRCAPLCSASLASGMFWRCC